MNEIKNLITSIVIIVIWSAVCFFAGWIFSDKRADARVSEADRQYRELKLKYDEQIRASDERISELTKELQRDISVSTGAVKNLRELVDQVRKQTITI